MIRNPTDFPSMIPEPTHRNPGTRNQLLCLKSSEKRTEKTLFLIPSASPLTVMRFLNLLLNNLKTQNLTE